MKGLYGRVSRLATNESIQDKQQVPGQDPVRDYVTSVTSRHVKLWDKRQSLYHILPNYLTRLDLGISLGGKFSLLDQSRRSISSRHVNLNQPQLVWFVEFRVV